MVNNAWMGRTDAMLTAIETKQTQTDGQVDE